MKKIVVVGAGYAGILTAKKLEKKFRKRDDVSISIIDKNPFHTMLTELHEVAANRVEEDSIRISLKKVFAGRKVNVIMDKISNIDFTKKKLTGDLKDYDYDYLVMAAGSKPTFFGVPGAEEFSYTLWSYDDAVILKDRIHTMFRMAACEGNLEKKKKLLTFHVVGAGFTGVEMVGELAEYVPILCEQYEIDRSLVTMVNVDVLSRTVPILPEKLSNKVEKRLAKTGVSVQLETGVVGIGEDYIELKKNDKVTKHVANTIIWTAGIESSDITTQAAQTLKTSGRGRLNVDKYLRSENHEDVYVVGDNMMYIPDGEKAPVPQMVENCEQSAHTAAHNIIAEITGNKSMEEYKPSFHGVMVSVGGKYGTARVGLPNLMFNLPSFLAMFAKHFINIVYFVQVLGWNKIFSYIKHEFFTIRHTRSFVGGHFSNRTPSFLLMPLRVWLGAVWVFEGILKGVEGWFKEPMLNSFFGGADAWYKSIINGASGGADAVAAATGAVADTVASATGAVADTVASASASGVADAVASATGAVADTVASASGAADVVASATGAVADIVASASGAVDAAVSSGTAIFSYNILGIFDAIFVSGKDVAASKLADYAFKIDMPLMNWFVDNVILSSDDMQIFMQSVIVILEILIGLALIGGLFTTPASFVSVVLQVMFLCTTGLYLNTVWMVFAGIAVLIGGGRTLGLDYWAMPALKRAWKKVPFVRRWYIYND